MTKRFGLVLVVLMLVAMVLGACSSDTKDVAEDFTEAMLKGNVDKVQEKACESFKDAAAAEAALYGQLDIQNLDLKYDVGKGQNTKEIIVSGSFDVGKGDDAQEFELVASFRDTQRIDESELIDTRIVVMLEKEDGDWCVGDKTELGEKSLKLQGLLGLTEPQNEEVETTEEEAEPAATEEAEPAATEEAEAGS